jgi:hypothetical protein
MDHRLLSPLKVNSLHQITEKESPEWEASPVCYSSNADMSNSFFLPPSTKADSPPSKEPVTEYRTCFTLPLLSLQVLHA